MTYKIVDSVDTKKHGSEEADIMDNGIFQPENRHWKNIWIIQGTTSTDHRY